MINKDRHSVVTMLMHQSMQNAVRAKDGKGCSFRNVESIAILEGVAISENISHV